MTYFSDSSSFSLFLQVAANKSNQNIGDRIFLITLNTLFQLIALLNSQHFTFRPIQNKTILTTSSFHDIFAIIFQLSTHVPP